MGKFDQENQVDIHGQDGQSLEQAPRLVGPEVLKGGISIRELAVLASMAHTPLARRELLKLALVGTGVVTGVTLFPKHARAQDASGDGGFGSDAGSSDASSADTGMSVPPPIPTTKVLPVFVNFRGGANSQFLFRHNGVGAPESTNGLIKAPPQTQLGVPANYLMVPSANGTGTEHFLHRWPDILVVDHDNQTNNHDEGYRLASTGDPDGTIPSPAVLNAYRYRPNSPFAYTVGPNVGLPFTGGLPVGANSLDTARLKKLSKPNNPNQNEMIFPSQVVDYLTSLRHAEIAKVLSGGYLPRIQRFARGRDTARGATQEIEKLLDLVKNLQQNQNDPFLSAFLIGTALFKEGYVASLSLARGGFDKHREIMGTQTMPLFQQAFMSFDKMLAYAETQKDATFEGTMIAVTSDFSRNGIGDDSAAHWPIGQTVVMGAPLKGQGPRRVGITNDHQDLIGEKTLAGDSIQHIRNLTGVGDNNFPVKTTIPGITSSNRIQQILDSQS